MSNKQPTIVVHGGAGAWILDSERMKEGVKACQTAVETAQTILLEGGRALDAVEAAVRILEDCPALDAGRGSYLNQAGNIEMDALIMDGRELAMGAVGAIQRVQYPISLARAVMEKTEHTFLVGEGASQFADTVGFPRCSLADLTIPQELAKHQALTQQTDYETEAIFVEPGSMGDTVGAVALDMYGDLATAVSTGGTRQKLVGRVGDSPLVGSGAYADNETAGVCATGHGESLMKVLISGRVCQFVGNGLTAQQACEAAIHLLERRVDGKGGLIAIDHQGGVGVAFNTDGMPYAYAVGSDPVVFGR